MSQANPPSDTFRTGIRGRPSRPSRRQRRIPSPKAQVSQVECWATMRWATDGAGFLRNDWNNMLAIGIFGFGRHLNRRRETLPKHVLDD